MKKYLLTGPHLSMCVFCRYILFLSGSRLYRQHQNMLFQEEPYFLLNLFECLICFYFSFVLLYLYSFVLFFISLVQFNPHLLNKIYPTWEILMNMRSVFYHNLTRSLNVQHWLDCAPKTLYCNTHAYSQFKDYWFILGTQKHWARANVLLCNLYIDVCVHVCFQGIITQSCR